MASYHRGGKGRRALSPLIATVILIAVTIVGGLMVYQYFQRSSEALIAAGESLFMKVTDVTLDSTSKLVYIEGTNGYEVSITVLDVVYYDKTGAQVPLNQALNLQVGPGDKFTATAVVPVDAVAVAVVYQVEGQTLTSEPVQLG